MRKIIFISIFLLLFLSLACKKQNNHPVISSITGPSEVFVEGTYYFECIAYDPDNDYLTYNWTCTGGTLSSTYGKRVGWTAPERSGNIIIFCEVRDGRGGRDVMNKSIVIKRITDTIIDWAGYIEAGMAYYWEKIY